MRSVPGVAWFLLTLMMVVAAQLFDGCLTTMRAVTRRALDRFPNMRAYLQRIGARPSYQRAMKKGDPEMKPALE